MESVDIVCCQRETNKSMSHQDLLNRITDNTAIIGVIGMGYVGLPLAITFADKGFSVVGLDVDPDKVKSLNAGISYIRHVPGESISRHVEGDRINATIDFTALADVDVILICVPTPLNGNREPDLSYVESTAQMIVPHLREGHLIVLESTTYPGCTDSLLKPILEQGGMKSGEDFYLAYSPEREDPGNPEFATSRIPKVVGGDGAQALETATALYDQIVVGTVPVSSMDVAEAVKLTENIFRSVNIALVNELKAIYEKIGINIWEVIEAAKTKPFGYMPFYPGPGLGGHCIPIDPFYLSWRAKQAGESTRFIELAGEINTAMPEKVINTLEQALQDQFNQPLKGASILLIGLAYKKNVDDTRESPAFSLIEIMETRGANVQYYDPHIPEIPITREYAHLAGRRSLDLDGKNNADFDALLICTDHDAIDFVKITEGQKLIIDTRNAISRSEVTFNENQVVRA